MTDVFDKIISGDIPAFKIYEDEYTLAFLDITQITPGHTLLIPKKDITDIFEYDDITASQVLSKLPLIARAIKASNQNIIGINIFSNNGTGAGQVVPHSHFHLVPRYKDDNFNITEFSNADQYDNAKYQTIANNIIEQLEG
ncbi:HIT family protein [Weissella coleopterorum]|uniref:HIT family protein n=1 Tax=Weissella coleopterorum TaxID=2714949 RepID=A0A6G8B036_9LACO|nr:HIT family protein [Weissella coleopterorum]QIL50575.1 HIT family protein [Weissella coleopterorum]